MIAAKRRIEARAMACIGHLHWFAPIPGAGDPLAIQLCISSASLSIVYSDYGECPSMPTASTGLLLRQGRALGTQWAICRQPETPFQPQQGEERRAGLIRKAPGRIAQR